MTIRENQLIDAALQSYANRLIDHMRDECQIVLSHPKAEIRENLRPVVDQIVEYDEVTRLIRSRLEPRRSPNERQP